MVNDCPDLDLVYVVDSYYLGDHLVVGDQVRGVPSGGTGQDAGNSLIILFNF